MAVVLVFVLVLLLAGGAIFLFVQAAQREHQEEMRLRLRASADVLARDTFGDDEDGEAAVIEAPLRPNPVTQDEVDAGSVELF